MDDPTPTTSRPTASGPEQDHISRIARRRDRLRLRHASALARLLEQREDLRGVHALADLVDDSLRWSA